MFRKIRNEQQAREEMVKIRLPKSIRNAFISMAVLLVLLVGGGVAYTFFMGPSSTQNATILSAPVATAPDPVVKPTKPAPNATIGASVVFITSPVTPGSEVSMSVKTNAGATCKIAVVYNKVASTDPGLVPKVADDYGSVSWTWTVGRAVPLGTWPATVTCANVSHSAVVRGDLVVAKQ